MIGTFVWCSILFVGSLAFAGTVPSSSDYIELHDNENPTTQNWVRVENLRTRDTIGDIEKDKNEIRSILDSENRIWMPTFHGPYVRIFRKGKWRGVNYERGVWIQQRREDYIQNRNHWDILLDLDQLSDEEGVDWSWDYASCLPPQYIEDVVPAGEPFEPCLLSLSNKGKDASIIREFDTGRKQFVTIDALEVPTETHSRFRWIDRNRIFLGTDFGPNTISQGGYPYLSKVVRRGELISKAQTFYRGDPEWSSVTGWTYFRPEGDMYVGFGTVDSNLRKYWIPSDSLNGEGFHLEMSEWARLRGVFHGKGIFFLQRDWTCGVGMFKRKYRAGQVILAPMKQNPCYETELLFDPETFGGVFRGKIYAGKNSLFIPVLMEGRGGIWELRLRSSSKKTFEWEPAQMVALPANGTLSVLSADAWTGELIVRFETYNVPPSLYLVREGYAKPTKIRSLPDQFDTTDILVSVRKTKNEWDGQPLFYFVAHQSGLPMDGKNPTLIYGQGGIRTYTVPRYDPALGRMWLRKGGVAAFAIVRGGSERGPAFAQDGMGQNRINAFRDLRSVARDLVRSKITSPDHLGIWGKSNGGLLMATVYTQEPGLFGAVFLRSPLTDMLRYRELHPRSKYWIGEYGDPDNDEDRAVIESYTPFDHVKNVPMTLAAQFGFRGDIQYRSQPPNVFFVTSSSDDRVFPGDARRMAARMGDYGLPYLYLEQEGGHQSSKNNKLEAEEKAMMFTFFHNELSRIGQATIEAKK